MPKVAGFISMAAVELLAISTFTTPDFFLPMNSASTGMMAVPLTMRSVSYLANCSPRGGRIVGAIDPKCGPAAGTYAHAPVGDGRHAAAGADGVGDGHAVVGRAERVVLFARLVAAIGVTALAAIGPVAVVGRVAGRGARRAVARSQRAGWCTSL